MKKYFGIFLVLVGMFFSIDKAAAFNVKGACLYEGKTQNGESFKVRVQHNEKEGFSSDESIWINLVPDSLDDTTIRNFDKNYKSNDFWLYTWNNPFKIKDSKNKELDGKNITNKILEEHGCFSYLYWQGNHGNDKWYFSDNATEKIKGNLVTWQTGVTKLELIDGYQKTSENAILEELFCTYMAPVDAHMDMPSLIIYRITPLGNNKFRYAVGSGDTIWFDDVVEKRNSGFGLIMDSKTEVLELLNPRVFQFDATKSWACPTMIRVGHSSEITSPIWSTSYISSETKVAIGFPTDELDGELDEDILKQLSDIMSVISTTEHNGDYSLVKDASYIEYETGSDTQGKVCAYGKEQLMALDKGNWTYTIQEVLPFGKDSQFQIISKNNIKLPDNIDIENGILMEDCNDLPYIYTDCLNSNTGSCKVSDTEFNGSTKLVQNAVLNEVDGSTVQIAMGRSNGYKYKKMICELGDRLHYLDSVRSDITLNNINLQKLHFYDYDGTGKEEYGIYQVDNSFCTNTWNIKTEYECDDDCLSKIDYSVEKKVREITEYCNEVYKDFTFERLSGEGYKARLRECAQFNSFYSNLVSQGVVNNLSTNCGLISNEFGELLVDILNIIKIAGPILAIILGMIDFVKVIVSGDPDKENKKAFASLTRRLIAACLLFLVPIILSFIMNMFLTGSDGYDPNDPFCSVADWNNY